MKKIFFSFLLLTSIFGACTNESENDDFLIIPFEGICAQDGSIVRYAEIDNRARTAHLFFVYESDISNIEVTFYLREGFTLLSPLSSPTSLNLNQEQRIAIEYHGEPYVFILTADPAEKQEE